MRTAEQFVADATYENSLHDFFTLSILVGCGRTLKAVPFKERSAMVSELSALMERGGDPLGLLATVQSPGKLELYTKVFAEHVDDESVAEVFDALLENYVDELSKE
jgi:hypothetical protein